MLDTPWTGRPAAPASAPMTNHQAGTDCPGSLRNSRPWRHHGRCYLLAVVPLLHRCILLQCAREGSDSRASGCASRDQQLDRHDHLWIRVPTESSLRGSLPLLRLRPRNLSQRGGCACGPTALPPGQFTARVCATTSDACRRAGAAAPGLNAQVTLSGRREALAPPSRILALKVPAPHSHRPAALTLKFRPQGHCSILHFCVSANGSTGGNISLGIVDSLNASRAAGRPLPEPGSAG